MRHRGVFQIILLLSMSILFCIPACALGDNAITDNVNRLEHLSNSQLAAIIQIEKYDNWALYQPTSRESEVNTSSENFLSYISVYPIVAIQNEDVHLFVLKKSDSGWNIAFKNEFALVREGFKIIGFSIDENNTVFELTLQLSALYPSFFSALHFENRTLLLNYDRGLTYKIEYPFLMTTSLEIDPDPYVPFDADIFSLQRLPITLEDLMVPAKVCTTDNSSAELFIIPDETSNPIIQLTNGEDINIIHQKRASEWIMVYYVDNILFIPEHNVNVIYK